MPASRLSAAGDSHRLLGERQTAPLQAVQAGGQGRAGRPPVRLDERRADRPRRLRLRVLLAATPCWLRCNLERRLPCALKPHECIMRVYRNFATALVAAVVLCPGAHAQAPAASAP